MLSSARTRVAHVLAALAVGCATLVAVGAAGTPALADEAPDSAAPKYYVSLGDSYSIGHQPGKGSTRNGYANQVIAKAKAHGQRLKLVNFGCGGATTMSILVLTKCESPAVKGAAYRGRPQADAAIRFINAHRGDIALITVSIGGNDVTKCAGDPDPIACVATATNNIKTNVARLASDLRAAAGPEVLIVGTTYPDVILGQWVYEPVDKNIAELSVTAFKALINPALLGAYQGAGATFVDVTDATGAYTPLDQVVTVDPYGEIPTAVARVCELTYYCTKGDIHAKTPGYGIIADLIVAALPA